MCPAVVAIESYEGQNKNSESVEARYPDISFFGFENGDRHLEKKRKDRKTVLKFRFCTVRPCISQVKLILYP